MNVHSACLLSTLLGISVYLTTLRHELVFDDIPAIKYNKDLRPDRAWSDLLLHDYWGSSLEHPTSHKSYRPLCVATFRLNYLWAKLEPMSYHLVNVLLHGVVCYLYVALVSLVCSAVWPALIAGLLFAVHPIHTEAVAGVVGRAELLCAVFYLLCIITYQRAIKQQGVRWSWLSVSLLCSVLALLSKELGITALAVCLAIDLLLFNKFDLLRQFLSPSAGSLSSSAHNHKENMKPMFIRGIAVGVVGLVAIVTRILISNGQPTAMFKDSNINPALSLSWPWRQLSWSHLSAINSWLLLHPSHLTADWRFDTVPLTLTLAHPHNLHTLLTLLSLLTLTTFALWRHCRPLLFGLSLLVFPYVPASNLFFPVGFVVAERVLYLPSMGLCLCAAHGIWRLLQFTANKQWMNLIIKLSLSFLLLTHVIKTVHRSGDWRNSLTLYKAGVKLNPHNGLLLNNIGIQYAMIGDHDAAVRYYTAAMVLSPNYTGSYYNYGKLMNRVQQYHKAEEPLRRAIAVAESTGVEFNRLPESYHLLIQTLLSHSTRLHEAHSLINHALTSHNHHSYLHADKCHILELLNRTLEAVQSCEHALTINPSSRSGHQLLGTLYTKLGREEDAERMYRELLLLEPDNGITKSRLASLLQHREEFTQALTLWEDVLSVDPNNVDALLNVALVQESLSRTQEAVDSINKALTVQPFNRQALYQAAELLYRHGNLQETVRVLTRLYNIDSNYSNTEVWLASVQTELSSGPNW